MKRPKRCLWCVLYDHGTKTINPLDIVEIAECECPIEGCRHGKEIVLDFFLKEEIPEDGPRQLTKKASARAEIAEAQGGRH